MRKILCTLFLIAFAVASVQASRTALFVPYAVVDTAKKGFAQVEYELYLSHRYTKDRLSTDIARSALEQAAMAGHDGAQEQYFNDLFYGNKYIKIKKDAGKASSLLVKWAKEGKPWAKYETYSHRTYKEVKPYLPDEKIIFQWLEEAAQAGHIEAMYERASACRYGIYGALKDTAQAIALYERILKNDYKELNEKSLGSTYKHSCSNLAAIVQKRPLADDFAKAADFEKDSLYALASVYYESAAKSGNAKAMERMAHFYDKGLWVDKDKTLAMEWYRKAAQGGDRDAQLLIAQYDAQEKEKQAQLAATNVQKSVTQTQTAVAEVPKKQSKFANFMDKLGATLDAVNNSVQKIADAKNGGTQQNLTPAESLQPQAETDDTEYYYIPDVLKQIDQYIRVGNNNIQAHQQAAEKTRQNVKYKYTRVGSRLIKVIDTSQSRIYTSGCSVPSSVSASGNAYYSKVKQSFSRYAMVNKTDYIPVEKYNQIWKAHSQAQKRNAEIDKDFRTKQSNQRLSNIYQNYVSSLIRYSGKANRDLKWIYQVQENMKKVREKCGCKKSPWEMWDGIHDPG